MGIPSYAPAQNGYNAPSQVFEHCLDARKGWFHEAAIDFNATLSPAVTFIVFAGRCAHLNAAGQFELGLAGTQMAIFLMQDSKSYDVANPTFSAAGTFVQQSIMPAGMMSGLVAKGAYELATTEYDQTQTYAINDLLGSDPSNTDSVNGGLISNHNIGGTKLTVPWAGGGTTNAICGVVSGQPYQNSNLQNQLPFWPVFLPGTT
jgi:hypothetical protein